jgi:hypothetical protein
MSIEISSIDVVLSKHKIKPPSMVVFHFIRAGLPFGTIKVPLAIINSSRAYFEHVNDVFRGDKKQKQKQKQKISTISAGYACCSVSFVFRVDHDLVDCELFWICTTIRQIMITTPVL